MQYWTCIFDAETNRGKRRDINGPGPGEFAVTRHPSQCAWFDQCPERYQFVDGVISEWPGWEAEQFQAEKDRVQTDNKSACENHILKRYPLTTQSSMDMGIYPVELKEAMIDWIAACIAEENRVFDLVGAATTREELASIIPTWPEA